MIRPGYQRLRGEATEQENVYHFMTTRPVAAVSVRVTSRTLATLSHLAGYLRREVCTHCMGEGEVEVEVEVEI
jgi:phosphatidate phosphatase APP1